MVPGSLNFVYAARYRDPGWRDHAERAGEVWRAELANRRFATAVRREAFAYGRPVMHEIVHLAPERLERAAVAREAPRIVPAAARIIAGPGGLRAGVPQEMAPRMTGLGGLHGNAAVAPQRVWPEHLNPAAGVARPEAQSFGRIPGPAGQHIPQQPRPPEGFHPAVAGPQYGRPEGPHTPALGPQFGHPEAPHAAVTGQQFGRPEVPHMAASAAQGAAFGRPEAFHTPAPTYHAGAPQFGRPEVVATPAMPRPGAPQVTRPGAPAIAGRAAPGMPQVAARPVVATKPVNGGAAPQQKKK